MMMELIRKSLKEIKPADYNPRKISKRELEKLKKSIMEFGYVDPIIWNKRTNHIIGGHQRYKALLDLGYKEADVVELDVSETEEKALNIGLNKITGEFDIEKLKDVLQDIDVGGVDIELTGFDISEIEEMMTRPYQEFGSEELDLDDFDDENFECKCPECGFHFNAK
jgi:ParB-like chromosome segregation protein Spo0J